MSITVMKQALQVLEDFVDDPRCQKQIDDASIALRQAIEQAEKQEPAGWRPATFHRDNVTFNPGLPDEQTVKFWKLQNVEIEYCYTTPQSQAEVNDLERLRDENERLHVENRRLIDRIEVMGVPVGVGGYATTTTTPQPQREWVDRLCRIMGTFDLSTGHADTMDELLDSLESELKDVLGYYRQRREWVGLTPDDLTAIFDSTRAWNSFSIQHLYTAINAKLKERNT